MHCPLTEIDRSFEAFSRTSLDVVMDALKTAPNVRYWCRGEQHDGPSDCLGTPFDSDAIPLRQQKMMQEHVIEAFVVALHVLSDSCAISGCGYILVPHLRATRETAHWSAGAVSC